MNLQMSNICLPNSAITNEDLSCLPNLMSSRCDEVQLPQVGNAERRNPNAYEKPHIGKDRVKP